MCTYRVRDGYSFLMDNRQYHWALNWEGKVKKKSCWTHLASSGDSLHVLSCLITLLKMLLTCCAKGLLKLLDSLSMFIQDQAGREVCQSCFQTQPARYEPHPVSDASFPQPRLLWCQGVGRPGGELSFRLKFIVLFFGKKLTLIYLR